MPCFRPLRAWQSQSGEIFFKRDVSHVRRELLLPCGRCIGCRVRRGQEWAMRCMHERQLHDVNSAVTLTYSPENLPADGNLNYSDFQAFMKALRKKMARYSGTVGVCKLLPIKFFMCGEYGELFSRPHYHACLFGVDFPDRKYFKRSDSGADLYTSELLSSLWTLGHSTVGDLTFDTAAYVAGYCCSKVTGDDAEEYYQRVNTSTGEIVKVVPEFGRASNGGRLGSGAIGSRWFDKFRDDVISYDHVIVDGRKIKPPRYYDKLLQELDPARMEEIKLVREEKMKAFVAESTEARLAVREEVLRAKFKQKKRNLE